MGVKNPKVALVNIGAEEEKGNELVKGTFPLLKANKNINFIGNIEARDIPAGKADVIVTEAFVGNVILKMYEGVGAVLIRKVKEGMLTSLRSKIGALLVKPALKKTLKGFDVSEYGRRSAAGTAGSGGEDLTEAPGRWNSKNSILQCIQFKEQDLSGKIQEHLAAEEKVEGEN